MGISALHESSGMDCHLRTFQRHKRLGYVFLCMDLPRGGDQYAISALMEHCVSPGLTMPRDVFAVLLITYLGQEPTSEWSHREQ